jgi:hypothetical protein
MIFKLKRFLWRNFCPAAKAAFLELFQQNDTLCRAFVMVEMSPLAGIQIKYVWQEFRENAHLNVSELSVRTKTRRIITDRVLSKTEFIQVFHRFEDQGLSSLGNYSGRVKDGVSYSLCWGTASTASTLSISNPQVGSKLHEEFIKNVKKLASLEY